jgi:predicted nucleic acid-binding protein
LKVIGCHCEGAQRPWQSPAARPRSALDMIIAAVAEATDCVVVPNNEKDFAGLEIVNPSRTAN